MIRFANACIGHLRGGLAMASVLACMLFAAVSGSSPATVEAVGSIVIAGTPVEVDVTTLVPDIGEPWDDELAPAAYRKAVARPIAARAAAKATGG